MRRRSLRHLVMVLAAATLACSDPGDPRPQSGMLQVSVALSGNATDSDGFLVTLRGQSHRLALTDTLRLKDVSAGEHTIRVSDVAPHCAIAADSLRVVVPTGSTTSLRIDAECYGRLVYTKWFGESSDALHYLDDRGQSRKLTAAMSGGQWQPRWSPDGTHVLFERMDATGDFDVWVADLNGNAWPVVARVGDREVHPTWSPDGQWVLYVHIVGLGRFTETDLRRVRPDGTGDHSLLSGALSVSPTYSPDGRFIAFGCWLLEHGICYLTADGELIGRAPAGLPHAQNLAWSPDGRHIAAETMDQRQAIQLLRVTTGEAVDLLPGQTSFGSGYWSPDGSQLAFKVSEPGRISVYVASVAGAAPRRVVETVRWLGPWSPDGAKLPVGLDERAFHLLDTVTGRTRVLMSGDDTYIRGWWRPSGASAAAALRGAEVRPHVEPAALTSAAARPVRIRTDATGMTSLLVDPM